MNNTKPNFLRGCVGRWAYRGGGSVSATGTWKDYSGNGNDGTCNGDTYIDNQGANFDGTGDYIDFGTDTTFDTSKPLTISLWHKVTSFSSSNYPTIITVKTDQPTGFVIFASNRSDQNYGCINFGSDSGFVRLRSSFGGTTFLNEWKHITVVYDGVSRTSTSSYKLYIDGIEDTTGSADPYNPAINVNYIGYEPPNYFNGNIDNVQIYNRALSAGEITQLYHATKGYYN